MRIVGVVLLALALPAGCGRDAAVSKSGAATETSGGVGDHWHAAFAVWDCDAFLPPFSDEGEDRFGIHSHDDGLIHLHPFDDSAAGDKAVLGRFLDQVGIEATASKLSLPGRSTLEVGDDCAGQPGELVTLRWADVASADPPVVSEGADKVPLTDCSAVVLAFRAPGATIDLPPSVSDVGEVSDLSGGSFAELCSGGSSTGRSSSSGGPSTTGDARPSIALPEGATRASFAFWLVGSTAAAPCAPPAVPTADGALCYTPADTVRLGADIIKSARVETNPIDGAPHVAIEFSDAGVLRWRELVGAAFADKRQIAIEYGGVVLSAPTVQDDFSDTKEAVIAGGYSAEDAEQLARVLNGR